MNDREEGSNLAGIFFHDKKYLNVFGHNNLVFWNTVHYYNYQKEVVNSDP